MQGYNVLSLAPNKQSAVGYDTCLTDLLTGLLDRPDHKEGSVLILSNVLISLEICVLCVCISYSRTTQDESVPDAANSLASCPLSLLADILTVSYYSLVLIGISGLLLLLVVVHHGTTHLVFSAIESDQINAATL